MKNALGETVPLTNDLGITRFVVEIETTRGTITIECEKGCKNVGYHYKPIDKMDLYQNGPISEHDKPRIEEALRYSWIERTPENIEQVANAAALVRRLANVVGRITSYDEHRILSEIICNREVKDILAVGEVDAILREALNNEVMARTADTVHTFDDMLMEIVREMMPAGTLLVYDDVYSQLREHFNNDILEKWEEEQSKT